jgi:hypothetical protein
LSKGVPDSDTQPLAGHVVACRFCHLWRLPGWPGSSAWFAAIRPYLLGASVLLIGFAFFQAHRSKQCNRRPARLSMIVLWLSASILAVMIFFSQVVAGLVAGG